MGGAWGLRPSLLQQVVPERAVLDAGGSPPGRHEGRFTDTPPGLAYGASMPRLTHVAAGCGTGRSRLSLGCWPCPRQGTSRCSRRAGCRVGPVSFRERAAPASLSRCESWRGRGCALGFMAATLQRKQFPRRCAASSRNKFFSLPGAPRCCARCAVRPAHPPPAGSQQGRDGRDLVQPERRKHHG